MTMSHCQIAINIKLLTTGNIENLWMSPKANSLKRIQIKERVNKRKPFSNDFPINSFLRAFAIKEPFMRKVGLFEISSLFRKSFFIKKITFISIRISKKLIFSQSSN